MEEKKLYGSLKRLQNFPLDLTCVYETYAEAEAYCKKKNSKAYLGQVIAVWNDKDEINNSIYFVCKDSDDNLILKRPVNKKDLDNGIADLKKEIEKEILEKYNELKAENLKLSERVGLTESSLTTLNNDLVALNKKHSEDIDAVNTKIDKNIESLDSRINEIIDDKIPGNYEDLKDIADWIKQFIGDDGTLNSLGAINKSIQENRKNIEIASKKIETLDSRVNETNTKIDALKDANSQLNASIQKNSQAIEGVKSKLPITYKGILKNTTKIAEGLTENDEIEEITINICTADEDDKVAGFKVHVVYTNEDDDILISASDDANCDYIDISSPGTYKYLLNYNLSSEGSIMVDWTDNTETPTFEAEYNVKVIKNIIKKTAE